MNTLQKHVIKEILAPFIIAFMVITVLMLTGSLFKELADRFLSKALGLNEISMIVLYLLPTLVIYTVPIALLFATLMAFVRFSHDCEIIAMQAAGIPIRRVFYPAIAVGGIMTLFLFVLWAEIAPMAARNLKMFVMQTVLKKPTLVLNEQAWTKEVNGMRIFVGEIDNRSAVLHDIDVMIKGENGPDRTIVAKSGKVFVDIGKEDIYLELNDGEIHEYDLNVPDEYSTTSFSKLTIPVNINAIDRNIKSSRNYRSRGYSRKKEMSLIQVVHDVLDPATDPEEKRALLTQISERTAFAFMPLTFVLIGAPLGVIPYKTRRFYGPAICAGLLLAYYALFVLGEALSKNRILHPLIAMWIPNILLGSVGIIFMFKAERR